MSGTGRLFLGVGNSGSGKDALLTEILQRWPDQPEKLPPRLKATLFMVIYLCVLVPGGESEH